MSTRLLATALLASTLLLGACSSDCEDLAEKICACEGTRAQVDACKRRAAQRESSSNPGAAAQERCAGFVDTCDCHALGTAAGDRACGLAE